jgi:hypothetical protein
MYIKYSKEIDLIANKIKYITKENEKIINKDSISIEENKVNLEPIFEATFGAMKEAKINIKKYPKIINPMLSGSKMNGNINRNNYFKKFKRNLFSISYFF